MIAKRIFQLIMVAAILVTSFASTGGAMAWSGCASYITVQWGDTLSGLARLCGTTAEAIQAANPGLGWWVYAGQVLYIPTGYTSDPVYYPSYGGNYVVQRGDTLGKIAAARGVGVSDLLAANPQKCIRIPMSGNVRSLNLSTAAGIILYEALRQTGRME